MLKIYKWLDYIIKDQNTNEFIGWKEGTPENIKEDYSKDFEDLKKYREEQGMPLAGSVEDNCTAGKLKIGNSEDVKTDIYNPFSLMNAFFNNSFGSYWFSTGTPTFLTLMIRNSDFDFKTLENDIEVGRRTIENYRLNSKNVLPMLYQTALVMME